ncbi:unnamed protein product [Psylliodes chrysocephalus]|uniref:Uncharacterized protein n=1 Tax=Psylliodes chrysocephalus TaxID=3402493 RepID=A0A9P0CU88_9CUCU|nr:unnamed protein product [Psylliodes chrysocephala]
MYDIKILNIEGSCTDIPSREINKICRACLKQEGTINLFQNKHKDLLFCELFTLFSLFQAEQEDGFPQNICQFCADLVTQFYSFKQIIKENHIILQISSEINNLDKSASFKDDLVTAKIRQPNVDSTNSDLILDILNDKENVEITNGNSIRLETSNKPENEDNLSLPLDHDYAKICNVEIACPCCFQKFSSEYEFMSHRMREAKQIESSSNIEEFTCLFCYNKFGSRNDFFDHMKLLSDENELKPIVEEYTCPKCNLKLNSRCEFLKHRREEINEEINDVPEPLTTFKRENEGYTCPKCNLKFNSRFEFLKHRRDERNGVSEPLKISKKEYHCKRCKLKFNTHKEYAEHKKQEFIGYTCTVCNIKFLSRTEYILHKKEEAAKKPKIIPGVEFVCPYCSLKFYSRGEYMKHRKEEARKKSLCPYCKKVLHTSRFDNHLRSIHKKLPPLTCDICKKRFVSSTCYNKHIIAHRDGFACEICGRKCLSANALTTHKKTHEREKPVFTCEICGKIYKLAYLFREHMYVHTGEKPFLCSVCGATFISQSKLNQHTLDKHTERPFKCELCGNIYDTEEKLNRHTKRHEDGKNNVCNICGQEFLMRSCLTMHLKSHDLIRVTRIGKKRKVSCLTCYKEYFEHNLVNFQMHIRTHLGQSPYLCLFCGKQFHEENEYNIHMALHGNRRLKKLHKCDICFGIFASNAALSNHMRCHTGEKPFQCTQCGKSFNTRTHLKTHMFWHTGQKPFLCKYCNKSFAMKGNCVQHERTHEGSGDYNCRICGKQFHTGSNLRKHHQKIHIKSFPGNDMPILS